MPVVGTRVDGADEVIKDGENGYLLDPGDVAGIAERVRLLLDDRDLRAIMGRRAATGLSVEFDIYEMVRQQEQEYDRLIAEWAGRIGSRSEGEAGLLDPQTGKPVAAGHK